MRDQVQKALNNIRPFLQADNGDVELVEVSEDGIVKVKLLGACEMCPLSVMTISKSQNRKLHCRSKCLLLRGPHSPHHQGYVPVPSIRPAIGIIPGGNTHDGDSSRSYANL